MRVDGSPAPPRARRRRTGAPRTVLRFVLLTVVTLVVLAPLEVVVVRALQGPDGLPSVQGLLGRAADPATLIWFRNSAIVTAATVLATVAVGAPAAYVLSRARSRAVDVFALVVFALQALPSVLLLTPLFIVFIGLRLVDDLRGLIVAYVGLAAAIAIWAMTAFFDAVPIELEEAAWLDGCSVLGAFVRVVLPNAAPGLLSAGVTTFLLAWNEYLVALIFVQSDSNRTVALALAGSGSSPALALLALLPPLVVFAICHRVFRFTGFGGAVTGS